MSDSKFVGNTVPFWKSGRIQDTDVMESNVGDVMRILIDLGIGEHVRFSLVLKSKNVEQQRHGQLLLSKLCNMRGISRIDDSSDLHGLVMNCALIRIDGAPGIESDLVCVDFRSVA